MPRMVLFWRNLMKDLLYAIVEDLVEDKDSIKITEDAPNEEGVIVLHLNVDASVLIRRYQSTEMVPLIIWGSRFATPVIRYFADRI